MAARRQRERRRVLQQRAARRKDDGVAVAAHAQEARPPGRCLGRGQRLQPVAVQAHLANIRTLAEAGINIRALSLADTSGFGILRLIVNNIDDARKLLQNKGFTVQETDVIAVEIPDKPGGLANVLSILGKAKINIEYMYAFSTAPGQQAVVIFRFSDPDRALAELQQRGLNVVEPVRLLQG